MAEAREVCSYIEGAASKQQLLARFVGKMSPGFDPARDLVRVGVANQTTMLSGESLAIAAELRKSMARRYGRSEEHTSELQSHSDLVCRLLLEKKKHITPQGHR